MRKWLNILSLHGKVIEERKHSVLENARDNETIKFLKLFQKMPTLVGIFFDERYINTPFDSFFYVGM